MKRATITATMCILASTSIAAAQEPTDAQESKDLRAWEQGTELERKPKPDKQQKANEAKERADNLQKQAAKAQEEAAKAQEQAIEEQKQEPEEQKQEPPPAQEEIKAPSRNGIHAEVRMLGSYPFGNINGAAGVPKVSEMVGGMGGIELGLGYRWNRVYFGVYLSESYGGSSGEVSKLFCAHGKACSTQLAKYGLAFQYTLAPQEASVRPWFQIGAGLIKSNLTNNNTIRSDGYFDVEMTGFEIANVNVGADLRLGKMFGLGPFIGVSLDEFTATKFSFSYVPNGDGTTSNGMIKGDVPTTSMHVWTMAGIRGVFMP